MIENVTILGERCSGTNYLEQLLVLNFKIAITWKFGWKHFFGFNEYSNSDNTLFIGIIRHPYDWINSLYKNQYHLPKHLKNKEMFLNSEIYSLNKNNEEIVSDRNIYTKNKYKNIFELRYVKNNYLIYDMQNNVKNYILIKYEDLLNNFNETMDKIKNMGLTPTEKYPLNINYNSKNKKLPFSKKDYDYIENNLIKNKLNLTQEIDTLQYKL